MDACAPPGSEASRPALGMLWGHSADPTVSPRLRALSGSSCIERKSDLWGELGRGLGAGMYDARLSGTLHPGCHFGMAQSFALSYSSSDFSFLACLFPGLLPLHV